jgi:nitrite reductase/ring-hydroxylating ferredoxin subunit
VGGSGHDVGRAGSEAERLEQLRTWASEHFPQARETHWWSAQDYLPVDGVPFVGPMPRSGGKVFFATGYSKWGMTNAPAAGLRLAADLLGGQIGWSGPMQRRITWPGTLARGIELNAEVATSMVSGWRRGWGRPLPQTPPSEGSGLVGRDGNHPTAISTVNGRTCAVSAVCSHLKGIVTWNEAEKSWDCPLHGSRFAPDGSVLEGPATRPLGPAGPVAE